MKRPKELQTHGHITITVNGPTGRRQLSEQEVAERFAKILEMSPAERIRMSFRPTKETGEK